MTRGLETPFIAYKMVGHMRGSLPICSKIDSKAIDSLISKSLKSLATAAGNLKDSVNF